MRVVDAHEKPGAALIRADERALVRTSRGRVRRPKRGRIQAGGVVGVVASR